MKVELNLYATLARYLPEEVKNAGNLIEVQEGMTVGDLMRQLSVPDNLVKLIFVNGAHAGRESRLEDGCRLGVFPPVGGG
jgi:sulfur carrier protein ThiS